MKRKFMKALFVLLFLGTAGMIAMVADMTWKQYQDTREWQKTAVSGELKDVPPYLAKDYRDPEELTAVNAWTACARAVESVETDGGILEGDYSAYEEIWEQAERAGESYSVMDAGIQTDIRRLRLYLDIEKAMDTAYASPNVGPLQQVSERLYAMELEAPSPLHAAYLESLHAIAADYQKLSVFLAKTLPALGTFTDGELTASVSMDPKGTEKILAQIEKDNLTAFPFLKDLEALLSGNDWAMVLSRNEVSRACQAWSQARAEFHALQKSQYYLAGSITTYQEALDAGLNVRVRKMDGYTVDPESPVQMMSYKGTAVASDQYIRYGTPITVTLAEQYHEIPKPQNPPEPSIPEPIGPSQGTGDGWDDDWDEDGDKEGDGTDKEPGEPPKEEPGGDAGDTDWDAGW